MVSILSSSCSRASGRATLNVHVYVNVSSLVHKRNFLTASRICPNACSSTMVSTSLSCSSPSASSHCWLSQRKQKKKCLAVIHNDPQPIFCFPTKTSRDVNAGWIARGMYDARTPDGGTQKRVLVPIADGTEEMEAVIIVDVLRRAGIEVIVASVETGRLEVKASRGVIISADMDIDTYMSKYGSDEYVDCIAVPGGMPGAERLRDCTLLSSLLVDHAKQGRMYAAICAAPAVVLKPLGLLLGKTCTCHPAFLEKLEEGDDLVVDKTRASFVLDGQCLTSRGPGTAFAFSLEIVSALCGIEKAEEVAGPMCLPQETMNAISM